MKIDKFIILLCLGMSISICRSCVSDYLVYEEIPIPETVSFSNDILPIFNASCNMDGCHSQGGYIPFLTEEVAYMNLLIYGLVDTTDAESSLLYKRLISTTNVMPPDGSLPPSEIEIILGWIRQGARDN